MQSFLQYHRSSRQVKDQYKRDSHTDVANEGKRVYAIGTPEIYDLRNPRPGWSDQSSVRGVGEKFHCPVVDEIRDSGRQGGGSSPLDHPSSFVNSSAGLHGAGWRSRTLGRNGETVFVVGFDGKDDTMNPHNWSRLSRIAATANIALIAWVVGFASSIDSTVVKQASIEFNVSEITELLATGLFLVGLGVGALFAGPISETVGRNPVYIGTLLLFMIFVMASALAPNIGSQLGFRFIGGCFASTPLTCAGGSMSDLWTPMERVFAFPLFANAAFMGPVFGPVIGGFVSQSSVVSWRWTEWVTLTISGLVLLLVLLCQPETYSPTLLGWKAAQIRRLTGDDRYKAEVEIRDSTFVRRLGQSLYRPFLLTCSEPIIMLFALYLTIVYVLLFTFLEGYTFIFSDTYGFSQGFTGLAFLGIGVGLCIATLLVPFMYVWARKDLAKTIATGGHRLSPEFRLWYAMLGAPAIPVSLLWMGWTAYPWISYWSPLTASILFGYGILTIFITSYTYIIDSYEEFSASALTSVTLVRYLAAGGMVEAAIPFYKNLGVHWTLTIMGALSAIMVPVPYLFYVYGVKIRARSKYAVV